MNDYEETLRHPGVPITSGADMFKALGYTDIGNPIYFFDLNNDPKFGYIEDCIKENKPLPERYNANIIRLRDYQLGGMINNFREICESTLHCYEDAWKEYREEFNPEMPEDYHHFWYLPDRITLDKILPKYINLIDPVSMKWIDPEYPKVSVENGIYQYKINEPILTADPTFLYPGTKVQYESYEPDYESIMIIDDQINEDVRQHLPRWLTSIECLYNELRYTEPDKDETQEEFVRRTRWEVRNRLNK